jgi:hypothetical protein
MRDSTAAPRGCKSPRAPKRPVGELPLDRSERPFTCLTCGRERVGDTVPFGWYSLTGHIGERGLQNHRLGIYCSSACLIKQLPRIYHEERDMGTSGRSARLDPASAFG